MSSTCQELLASLRACEETLKAHGSSPLDAAWAECRRGDWMKNKMLLSVTRQPDKFYRACLVSVEGIELEPTIRTFKYAEDAVAYLLHLREELK